MLKSHTYRPIFYFGATFLVTCMLWGLGARMSFSQEFERYYMLLMLLGLTLPHLHSHDCALR